jgi:hypothetical protein
MPPSFFAAAPLAADAGYPRLVTITTNCLTGPALRRNGLDVLDRSGICSAVTTTSGQVIFVPLRNGSTSTQDAASLCGPEWPPGGWWVKQCTGQGNGSGATDEAVLDGCDASGGYRPVAGQPTTGPGPLLAFLKGACPARTTNVTCLGSDPGNNFHNSTEEWQTLVGKTFTMPVMCTTPTGSALAVSGTGNNASYAIQRMATVELCGFEMQPRAASTGWPTTGPCATSNPNGYQATDVTNGAGLFLVIKDLVGGPTGDWSLEEYTALRLTK